MKVKRFVAVLALAALGLAIGGINANNPNSERWSLELCAPEMKAGMQQQLDLQAPILGEKDDMLVRPLGLGAVLFYKLFCEAIPPGHPAVGWVKGAFLSFYLVAAFAVLIAFGFDLGKVFAACVLLAFSPASVVQAWKLTGEETFLGAGLFFLSAAFLLRLGNARSLSARLAGAAGVLALAGAAVFVKDTMKGYVPLFLILYLAFAYRRNRRVDRWQAACALGALLLAVGIALVLKQPAVKVPWGLRFHADALPFLSAKAAFMFSNALVQLVLCFHAAGALMLFAANRTKPRLTLLAAVVWLLLVFSPPLVEFNFHGMYVYPAGPAAAVLAAGFLMLVALFRVLWSRSVFPHNLFAAILIAAPTLVFVVTFFIGVVRDDASTRIYLPVLPFFAFLIVEAFARWRPSRVRWLLLASLLFFQASHFANYLAQWSGFNRVEFVAKRYLAQQDLSDILVLYNNELFPVGKNDLSALGMPSERLRGSRFLVFEPFKPADKPDALKEEVCLKALDLIAHLELVRVGPTEFVPRVIPPDPRRLDVKRTVMFYELFERASNPDVVWPRSPWLLGFPAYGRFAPFVIRKSAKPYSRGYWEQPGGVILTDYYLGREPDFVPFGAAARVTEFDLTRRYWQFPRWLEAIPAQLWAGVPLGFQVEAHARIRRVPEGDIGCLANVDRYAGSVAPGPGKWRPPESRN